MRIYGWLLQKTRREGGTDLGVEGGAHDVVVVKSIVAPTVGCRVLAASNPRGSTSRTPTGPARPCEGVGLTAAAAAALMRHIQHRPLPTHTTYIRFIHSPPPLRPYGGRAARRAQQRRRATASCMHARSHAAATQGATRTPQPRTPCRRHTAAFCMGHPLSHHTEGQAGPPRARPAPGPGPRGREERVELNDWIKAMTMDGKQQQVQSQSHQPPQRDGAPHAHPRGAASRTCIHLPNHLTIPPLGLSPLRSTTINRRRSSHRSIGLKHSPPLGVMPASLTAGIADDGPLRPQGGAGADGRAAWRRRHSCAGVTPSALSRLTLMGQQGARRPRPLPASSVHLQDGWRACRPRRWW